MGKSYVGGEPVGKRRGPQRGERSEGSREKRRSTPAGRERLPGRRSDKRCGRRKIGGVPLQLHTLGFRWKKRVVVNECSRSFLSVFRACNWTGTPPGSGAQPELVGADAAGLQPGAGARPGAGPFYPERMPRAVPVFRHSFVCAPGLLTILTLVVKEGEVMYDPRIGRFLEQDPSGFEAGDPNLYRYVHNSPTNATDPSGLL